MRFAIYPQVTNEQAGRVYRSCGFVSKMRGSASAISSYSLLTRTSKMSCFSFNLPAGPPSLGGTCPASALGFMYLTSDDLVRAQRAKLVDQEIDPASFICNGCFALKGQYGNPSNVLGQQARLMLVRWFLDQQRARRSTWKVPAEVYWLDRAASRELRAAANPQELARRAIAVAGR